MFGLMIAAMSLASASAALPRWHELGGYTFARYVVDFDKSFPASEVAWRRALFEVRLAEIMAHNARESSYKKGVNKFTTWTPEEIATIKGVDKRQLYREAAKNPKPTAPAVASTAPLPATVDWRTYKNGSIVTAIKDQGGCGSCWAFAATETLESHVALATGKLMEMAPQEFVNCAENPDECGGSGGCAGATAEIAFATAAEIGCWLEADYPYQAETEECVAQQTPAPVANITGFVQLPRNEYEPLLNAVATIGPISVSVDAGWTGYESGVFPASEGGTSIDHGVVVYGYGTDPDSGLDYWIVRNSWGADWGMDGYILLERQGANATCAVDKNNQAGVGCKDDPKEVTVCGTSAILYDTSYPVGMYLM